MREERQSREYAVRVEDKAARIDNEAMGPDKTAAQVADKVAEWEKGGRI